MLEIYSAMKALHKKAQLHFKKNIPNSFIIIAKLEQLRLKHLPASQHPSKKRRGS